MELSKYLDSLSKDPFYVLTEQEEARASALLREAAAALEDGVLDKAVRLYVDPRHRHNRDLKVWRALAKVVAMWRDETKTAPV